MSAKFHIAADGTAKLCRAKRGCPLGNTAPHGEFESREEAMRWAEQELAKQEATAAPSLAKTKALKATSHRAWEVEEGDVLVDQGIEFQVLKVQVDPPGKSGRQVHLLLSGPTGAMPPMAVGLNSFLKVAPKTDGTSKPSQLMA